MTYNFLKDFVPKVLQALRALADLGFALVVDLQLDRSTRTQGKLTGLDWAQRGRSLLGSASSQ